MQPLLNCTPINWATKPKPKDDACESQRSEPTASVRQVVPVYINPDRTDRLVQLEDTSRHLTDEQLNGCDSPDQSTDDLTASFLRLSTFESPSELFPALSVSVVGPALVGSPMKKRYYVVTVGRCAGVFWDTWCTYISISFVQLA